MEEWLLKRCAERSESSPFCRALVAHLRAGSDVSLYSSAEAFSAFVDNGGNVGLYEQCVRQARQAVEEARITGTFRLLDLGSGTGKLLLPLLEQLAPQLEGLEVRVTLVDAEEGMMEGLRERVKRLLPDSAVVESVKATFGEYVDTCEEEYDICLSSFALHYCVGAERRRVLEWIYDSCQVFLLFEFDVPQEIMDEPIDSESRFDYLVTRFDQGVAEYAGSSVCDLVVNGFLCPVFVLNYREKKPSAEVSAKLWTAEARAAGFEDVEVRAVYSYWWSDCFMLIGRSNASFDPRPFAALDVMQVHDYGVKGRGYRAKSDIAPGTLLLSERPMVVQDNEASRYRAVGRIVAAQLAPDSESAYSFLKENGFKVGNVANLFHRKSIFNHSCFPNCGLIGSTVVTLRKVNAGEELCISYIGGVLHSWRTAVALLPNSFRAAHLREIFSFACCCLRCEGLEAVEVEKQTQLIANLPTDFPRDVLSADDATRSRILSLINDENFLAFAPLLPAAVCWTMEAHWMRKCLVAFERFFPANFPATATLRELLALKG